MRIHPIFGTAPVSAKAVTEFVNILDHGAVGDGLTNDRQALVDAVTAASVQGKPLLIPTKNFLIDVTGQTAGLVLPANVEIIGVHRTLSKLTFKSTATADKYAFSIDNDNNVVRNISLVWDGPVNDNGTFFLLNGGNDLRVSDVFIDGGYTASNANVVNVFRHPNPGTNFTGLEFLHSEVKGCSRVVLRASATTSAASRLRYIGNYIHDIGLSGIQHNGPNGPIRDVQIIGNLFTGVVATPVEGLMISTASGQNFVIANNVFLGDYTTAIHMEEDARNISVTGNVIRGDGVAILLADNDVGGADKQPQDIVISGNTMVDGSGTQANDGIQIPVGVQTTLESARDIIISDNVLAGYDTGLDIEWSRGIKVRDNIIKGCVKGIQINEPGLEIRDNHLIANTTGLSAVDGGMFGHQFFEGNATLGASGTGRVSITGYTLFKRDVSLPATTTTSVNLGIPIGVKSFGIMKASMFESSSNHIHHLSEIHWNGTTFVDTEQVTNKVGSITDNHFLNNSSQLAWSLNNTTAGALIVDLQVRLDGMHIF